MTRDLRESGRLAFLRNELSNVRGPRLHLAVRIEKCIFSAAPEASTVLGQRASGYLIADQHRGFTGAWRDHAVAAEATEDDD